MIKYGENCLIEEFMHSFVSSQTTKQNIMTVLAMDIKKIIHDTLLIAK